MSKHIPDQLLNFSLKYYEYMPSPKHSRTEQIHPIPLQKKKKQRYTAKDEKTERKEKKETTDKIPTRILSERKSPSAPPRKPTLATSIDVSALYKQENTFRNQGKEQLIAEGDWRKVPIQFIEEQEESLLAGMRGRIVYRGYTPKNSWFYLRAVITQEEEPGRGRGELHFCSKFEGGNLQGAVRVSRKQYWLLMREDTNTRGLRQWFYFKVDSVKTQCITFRIYKYKKRYSLYRDGMRPFVSRGGGQWQQSQVVPKYQYDSQRHCYYLQFDFSFTKESVLLATLPPYTYTDLLTYLSSLQPHPQVRVSALGTSLAGLVIPLLTISTRKTDSSHKAIVVLSRTHPGQTCSNFALQSFISRIVGSPPLLSLYDFFVVPMVNPDGVVFGNHRTGLSGCDLNRRFRGSDPQMFPQVEAVRVFVAQLAASRTVELLFDLHGHSAKRNIFAYGDQYDPSSLHFMKSKALTKILSMRLPSFRMDYCVFRSVKDKKYTARVHFSAVTNALTFEESYGLIDDRAVSIGDWQQFGAALADSLLQYHALSVERTLQQFVAHEIRQETMLIQQRKEIKRVALLKAMESSINTNADNKSHMECIQPIERVCTEGKGDSKVYTEVRTDNGSSIPLCVIKDYAVTQVKAQTESIGSSQLSSGDSSCEMGEEEMEELRRELRIGCMREGVRRQTFNIPDKKIELKHSQFEEQPFVLHEHKKSIASRLLRLQMEKRESRRSSPPLIHLPTIKPGNK